MRVVVTGSSKGMGVEIAKKFLKEGHEVFGLDVEEASIFDIHYHHYICDVADKNSLPDIDGVNILINNAGVQKRTETKLCHSDVLHAQRLKNNLNEEHQHLKHGDNILN